MRRKQTLGSKKLNPRFRNESGITVRSYDILRRAVEEGVGYGYGRAVKYVERPTHVKVLDEHEHAIREHIADAIMGAICDVFEFPEPQ